MEIETKTERAYAKARTLKFLKGLPFVKKQEKYLCKKIIN